MARGNLKFGEDWRIKLGKRLLIGFNSEIWML
jgi:hypothetical protein